MNQLKKLAEEAAQGQVVSPVNFGSPGQVVIAGEKRQSNVRVSHVRSGANAHLPLSVSVPFIVH